MKSIFDNLYLYEIVLLLLGAFLFAILCIGLVYYILKKEDIKKLLYFFPIAIIMIAYPSIKEIQVGNNKIAMKENVERLLKDPDNVQAREELEDVTKKLEKRASSVKDLKALSEANLLLGNSDKAIDLTNKAIAKKQEVEKNNKVTEDTQSDTDFNGASAGEGDISLKTLTNIREVAEIQREIRENPSSIQDTLQIKKQIENTSWNNPRTERYLDQQIIRENLREN